MSGRWGRQFVAFLVRPQAYCGDVMASLRLGGGLLLGGSTAVPMWPLRRRIVLALGYQWLHHCGAGSSGPGHGVAIPARPLVADGMRGCGVAGAALTVYPGGRARSRAAGRRTPGGRHIGPSASSLIPEKKGPPTRSIAFQAGGRVLWRYCVISRYSSPLLAAGSTGAAEKIAAAPG